MANSWLRLWHDLPTDPKFRTIAKISGQPISLVLSVYIYLLVDASKNETDRGVTNVTLCNAESVTTNFDANLDQIISILKAMDGRLLNGNKIMNWDKRQPQKEDNSVARVRAYRERQKKIQNDVTLCNAMKRSVTTDKDKDQDQDKEKIYIDHFGSFWHLYPRKIAKKKCSTKFLSICKKDKIDPAYILDGLQNYLPHWENKSLEYIPHPYTWLTQGRWADDLSNLEVHPF